MGEQPCTPPSRSPPRLVVIPLTSISPASASPSGRRSQQDALTTIAQILWETCPWWEIRYEHAVLIRAALVERYRPATVNRHLAALRRVLKECWKLGLMTGDEYQLAASIENVENTTLPAGRALDTGEIRSLFSTIAESGGPGAARDAALFAVLYGGGLRRAEVVGLDLADYQPSTGALTVRHAKRQRERVVYATNGGQDALTAWLAVRGDEPGPLFCPVDRLGRVTIRALSTQSVYDALRRRGKTAGLITCSPHDLRRTCISDLLDAGADIATVQRLAGHASVQTTARYDRRGERTKRKAAELLHVPYVAPREEEPSD